MAHILKQAFKGPVAYVYLACAAVSSGFSHTHPYHGKHKNTCELPLPSSPTANQDHQHNTTSVSRASRVNNDENSVSEGLCSTRVLSLESSVHVAVSAAPNYSLGDWYELSSGEAETELESDEYPYDTLKAMPRSLVWNGKDLIIRPH